MVAVPSWTRVDSSRCGEIRRRSKAGSVLVRRTVVFGVIVWGCLYLHDARLRAILPLDRGLNAWNSRH
jgi:hypothetical protein